MALVVTLKVPAWAGLAPNRTASVTTAVVARERRVLFMFIRECGSGSDKAGGRPAARSPGRAAGGRTVMQRRHSVIQLSP